MAGWCETRAPFRAKLVFRLLSTLKSGGTMNKIESLT